MMRRSLLLAGCVFCLVSSGFSQGEEKIDPAKEASIRRLMDLTGMGKLGKDSAARMMDQLKPMLSRTLPPGERSQQIIDAFDRKVRERITDEALVRLYLPIYDHHFTREDIDGLIQFYQTPLGQKVIRALPQVMQDGMTAGGELGEKIARETLQELAEQYPELKGIQ